MKTRRGYGTRILGVLLAAVMAAALSACSQDAQETQTAQAQSIEAQVSQAAQGSETAGADQDSETDGTSILIAYFAVAENSAVAAVSSASVTTVDGEAKGLVRVLAEDIRQVTGGDLFSIQTSVEYPGDINELIDYAAEEQDEEARPELTSHIENPDDYDIIVIGYPNWWYDMPMVMYSFFEEYDFAGKTIIPFHSCDADFPAPLKPYRSWSRRRKW